MERKEILSVVLVGLLLLTMAIQTVQLIGLSNAQVIVPATATAKGSSVGTGGLGNGAPRAAGASLSQLPTMVGGC